MSRLFLLLLLPLAACATPREQCDRAATHDLRVLDQLIAETELNLSRGYAIEQQVSERPHFSFCYGSRVGQRDRVGVTLCSDSETVVRERPVAIDVATEKAKLAALRDKRAQTARRAAQDLADCQARFPQGASAPGR